MNGTGLAGLVKTRVSLFAALSALTGYLLFSRAPEAAIFPVTAAVFILAAGAGMLNQYQERFSDALMKRTRARPLPSGRVAPKAALWLSGMLAAAGLGLLFAAGGAVPAALGAFAILWYNGLYTPLKKKSGYAALAGAVVGTVPPSIGWVAAGGSLLDPRLAAVALFFFIWQVPHFWLVLLPSRREYERAGLRSMASFLSPARLERLTFVWVCAAAATALLMPLFGIVQTSAVLLVLSAAALWIGDVARRIPGGGEEAYRPAFMRINLFALVVMAAISVESLLY